MRSVVLALVLLGAVACGAPPPAEPPTVPALFARDGVLVIAHRGASRVRAENTLGAFEEAIAMGADAIEFDYHHSRDGVPVVIHDRTLDRTTDAAARWSARKIPVASKTWAQLRALDAGTWFGDAAAAGFTPVGLPSLEQALASIVRESGAVALIERKAGDADTLVDHLERMALLDRVIVQAFDWDFLTAVRSRAPSCHLAALGSKQLAEPALERLVALRLAAVAWNHEDVDAAFVRRLHARDLPVWVYTVDDPARARALVALGVDGLITNEPRALRRALAR